MKDLRLGLLFLLPGLVQASVTNYEVEIIIFEDAAYQYAQSENWPETAAVLEKKETEISPVIEPKLEWMPESEYRLLDEATKLRNNPDYNVLLHAAWKQQGLDKEQAFLISINSLTKDLYKPVITPEVDAEKPDINNEPENIDKQDMPPESYVDGTISLIMSRYLHFNTRLLFHKPVQAMASSDAPDTVAYQEFPILMERRMRSKVIHYIDHPMVGIIVLATPFITEDDKKEDTRPDTYKTL